MKKSLWVQIAATGFEREGENARTHLVLRSQIRLFVRIYSDEIDGAATPSARLRICRDFFEDGRQHLTWWAPASRVAPAEGANPEYVTAEMEVVGDREGRVQGMISAA